MSEKDIIAGLDLVLVHMHKNSVCFNRCIGFVLNMLKKQQRNLDSSFTVAKHPVYQIHGTLISMFAFQGQLNNYKINRLSLIVQVNIVLNVVDSD